ncbi:MAG: hypothetical protein AAF653_09905, partial [Chloroflexota bacterium]
MSRVLKWLLRGIVVLFGAWVVFSIGLVLAIILYGNRDGTRPSDAIIVLGAGIEADGSPSQT